MEADSGEWFLPVFSMDNGLVCRWLTGQAKISPKISAYYSKPSNQKKLTETIHQNQLILHIQKEDMPKEKAVVSWLVCTEKPDFSFWHRRWCHLV